jgi:pectate lyase
MRSTNDHAPATLGAIDGGRSFLRTVAGSWLALIASATVTLFLITYVLHGLGNGPTTVSVAFPGAQGGGALSVGGRGGTVYLVTNTADSGAGSLRACIDASGPRTCVFRTGGTIALLSPLMVLNPFLTIAGQTAPGGGIQITGPSGANAPGNPAFLVRTHDVVIRYLRIRRGHNAGEICNQSPWSCGASVEVLSNWASDNPYNIMFDHISAEWSNYDALVIVGSNGVTNQPHSITVSYSILGEELGGAGQVVGAAFGGYAGQGPAAPDAMTDLDVHHNLFAGTSHRMPLMTVNSGRLVNNFVYAWTYYPMRSKGLRDFINNYFSVRSGQVAPSHEIQAWTENAGNDTSVAPSFYLIGNVGPTDPSGTSNWSMTALTVNESASEASSPLSGAYQRSSPIPTPTRYIPIVADLVSNISSASGLLLNTARTAPYDGVGASRNLGCSGKWADAQDSVDSRIVNAVANGTTLFGSYTYQGLWASPQSQADLGGWPTLAAGTPCADSNNNSLPDVWESYWAGVFGLGSTLDPNGFNFGDAYTNLEHYINGMSPSP